MVFANGENQNYLPSPSSLDNLTYLSAVLKESLRMRPNSTPLPRITPHEHSVTLAGIDNIPPGTRVNTFQWFVHRDPGKWTQPNRWMPERWLCHEGDKLRGDEGILWAFGSGPRMCVGSHLSHYSGYSCFLWDMFWCAKGSWASSLARADISCISVFLGLPVMRYILALIFSNFKTYTVPDASFGLHPPGSLDDRLLVRFERLNPDST